MDTATNPVAFLRSLKGAPLSVLIAIRIFPGPASLLQLAAATGYDQHTCARATQALEAMGLLERAHYRAWRLTSAAQQLPLWTPGELTDLTVDEEPVDDTPRTREAAQLEAPTVSAPRCAILAFQPPAAGPDPDPSEEAATAPPEPKRAILALHGAATDVKEPKRVFLALQPAGSPGGGSGLIEAWS